MGKKKTPPVAVTTWAERFSQALTLLCNGRVPPPDLCVKWVNRVEDNQETLQAWVNGPGVMSLSWAQSIAVIDAAQVLADQPDEGFGHLDKEGDAHLYGMV